MSPPAGYSGTPLVRKLGVKAGMRVLLIDAPTQYATLLEPLPDGIEFRAGLAAAGPTTDLVQLFVTERARLQTHLTMLREALRPEVPVWVSWPKKAARVPTDVTEDTVREVALPMGWVDVKVCAVDATWSGLKLCVRRTLR